MADKKITKAKFEKSDMDRRGDKKHGQPEGSKADEAQDRRDMARLKKETAKKKGKKSK
jgi:hypothetical protein